jgi:hypothetical protein
MADCFYRVIMVLWYMIATESAPLPVPHKVNTMNSTSRTPAIAACIVAAMASAATAALTGNLVVNGDAETGDLTGWSTTNGMEVIVDSNATVRTTNGLSPGVSIGDSSFTGGTGPMVATAIQLVDLTTHAADIDAGDQLYDLTVLLQTRSPASALDQAGASFTFIDMGGTAVAPAIVFTAPATVAPFPWVQYGATGFVPVGTRNVSIGTVSTRENGLGTDSYIDNVTFSLVPEPGLIALGLLAGLLRVTRL